MIFFHMARFLLVKSLSCTYSLIGLKTNILQHEDNNQKNDGPFGRSSTSRGDTSCC